MDIRYVHVRLSNSSYVLRRWENVVLVIFEMEEMIMPGVMFIWS